MSQMSCTHQALCPMQDIPLPCFGNPSSFSTCLKPKTPSALWKTRSFPGRCLTLSFLLSCFLFLLWEERGFFFKAAFKHLGTSQLLNCFSSPSLEGVDLWPPFESLQQISSSGIHMVLPRQRSSTHPGFLHLLPRAQSWVALLDFSALNL